ncbi:hypothetical protein NPIL_590881 [Nephila pilipes]|uniref:Uncharacterized protein n=1 Tax=Nephila pilipes TaxID=299642 RepID=A0A8X6MN06_NEPPI|nr:hypothetical protein NPIL_590881 [Nephila pilipes]
MILYIAAIRNEFLLKNDNARSNRILLVDDSLYNKGLSSIFSRNESIRTRLESCSEKDSLSLIILRNSSAVETFSCSGVEDNIKEQ